MRSLSRSVNDLLFRFLCRVSTRCALLGNQLRGDRLALRGVDRQGLLDRVVERHFELAGHEDLADCASGS